MGITCIPKHQHVSSTCLEWFNITKLPIECRGNKDCRVISDEFLVGERCSLMTAIFTHPHHSSQLYVSSKTLRHTKCLTRKAHIVVGCMCACIMSYLLSIILSLQTLCMCFEDTHGQLFRGKVAPRCKAVHGHSLKESEVKITLLDTTATSDSSHPTYNYPTPKCLGD